MGMTLADEERFARPDTSVTGQVLKLVAANPMRFWSARRVRRRRCRRPNCGRAATRG